MTAPLTAVAMTSYNGARYLAAQLDSLARQTVRPAELVVGDDGSTDDTLAILRDFAARAPFPVHIRQNPQRLGYRANFIRAASRCTAPLIAFCDQDDIWHPEKIEQAEASFAASPDILLLYHNAMLIEADGTKLRPFYDTPPQPALAPALTLPPWHFAYGYSQVFRRELLVAAPYWSDLRDTYHAGQEMGHDLFYFMLAATLGSIAYRHDCLVEYRQHPGQTIGTSGRDAPSRLQRWLYRLENRTETYRYLATMAANNAALFNKLQDIGTFPQRAGTGEQAWALLCAVYHERAQASASRSLHQRLRAFRALEQRGAYAEGFWTFGRKARLKDAVLGVALAPLVARYGRLASEGDPTCRRGVI